jgi:hypothetical protein
LVLGGGGNFPHIRRLKGVLKRKLHQAIQGEFQYENAWILSEKLGDSISPRTGNKVNCSRIQGIKSPEMDASAHTGEFIYFVD